MAEINLASNNNKYLKKNFSYYKFISNYKTVSLSKTYENLVSSDKEMVNIWNACFASVSTKERLDNSLLASSSSMHVINRLTTFKSEVKEIKYTGPCISKDFFLHSRKGLHRRSQRSGVPPHIARFPVALSASVHVAPSKAESPDSIYCRIQKEGSRRIVKTLYDI